MIGFLRTRGPVSEEIGINRTEAINMALKNNELKIIDFNLNGNSTYFGIVPMIDYLGRESYDYYFTCSKDFSEIEYIHIYDHGEGCEEKIIEISEQKKLAIIGKCILFDQKSD